MAVIRDGRLFDRSGFRVLLPVTYLLSFGLVLLIPADFWDDLALQNNPDLLSLFSQAGFPPAAYVHQALLSLDHRRIIVSVLSLACWYLAVLCVLVSVRRMNLMPDRYLHCTILLTANLPLFHSRILQINLPSTIAALFFCAASLLFVRMSEYKGIIHVALRVCAAGLYMVSFVAQSFMVVYGLVIVLVGMWHSVKMKKESTYFARLIAVVRRFPDFLLLPPLFFFGKATLFPPIGVFTSYNRVEASGLARALVTTPAITLSAMAQTLTIDASLTVVFLVAGLLLLAAYFSRKVRIGDVSLTGDRDRPVLGLMIATLGLFLAVYPYVVVNRDPSPYDWDDRHQLVMVLASGAVLVYLARVVLREQLVFVALCGVLVLAVAQNITTYLAVIRDGHTQNGLVINLSRSDVVRQGTTFIVDVSRWPNLSMRRMPSSAEMNCLMKAAFGDERRFAAPMTAAPFDLEKELRFMERYKFTGTCFREFSYRAPILIKVEPGPKAVGYAGAVLLSIMRELAPDYYRSRVSQLVSISASSPEPIRPSD